MRWKQKINSRLDNISPGVKISVSEVETYETVHPFRKFNQINKEGYWKLPLGIDNLVKSMEKARLEKKWEVVGTIQRKLLEIGIIVKSAPNGYDEWYPKLLEKEIKAEKDFDNWLSDVKNDK
jgi:hypothetical protein